MPLQESPSEAAVEIHLEDRLQRRNCVVFVLKWCLFFFAAPILYIGFVQAGLCKRLGASDFVANLPYASSLLLAAFPVIMAWAIPQVRYLKTVIAVGYTVTALMGALMAAVIWLPTPKWLQLGMIIAHGAVASCSSGTALAFEWEILGRGVSENRRGMLFACTFSLGPCCAAVGSLFSQLVINNELFGWTPSFWRPIPYPFDYIILYGATVPLLLAAAYLVKLYVVPQPAVEMRRAGFMSGIFGGFGSFIGNRLILITCIAYMLVYSGTTIQNNMVLYTREMIGLSEDVFVGYQLAIRFSAKALAGLMLGWLLKKTNPRMNLLVTGIFVLSGIVWILGTDAIFGGGIFFLAAFGLNGGGELMGFYYPYYVLCLSPKSRMRRNMAFVLLLSAPVGFVPALFGFISDTWNLTTSFWMSLAITAAGLILVIIALPPRPRPYPEDLEVADLDSSSEKTTASISSA